jgi:hypothetical protein
MTRKEIIRFIGSQDFGGFTFCTRNIGTGLGWQVMEDQPLTTTLRTDRTPAV